MRIWIGGGVGHVGGLFVAGIAGAGRAEYQQDQCQAPKDYAACVLPLWQQDVAKTAQTSISNGYRITAPSVITADEILDIVKYKDGSRVSLYQGPPWAKSGSLRKSVRDCL